MKTNKTKGAVSRAIEGATVDLTVTDTVAIVGGALVVRGTVAAAGSIRGANSGDVSKCLQAASNSTKVVQGTMSKNITETVQTLTKGGLMRKQ